MIDELIERVENAYGYGVKSADRVSLNQGLERPGDTIRRLTRSGS